MAYSEELKFQAIQLYYEGLSGRAVGRLLKINKSSVVRWIKKRAEKIENAPKSEEITEEVIEADELFTFEKSRLLSKPGADG